MTDVKLYIVSFVSDERDKLHKNEACSYKKKNNTAAY